MMTIQDFDIGDRVYFGRNRGEQTLGRVVGKGRKLLKIEQLETRGQWRTRPAGTVWTVPPDFCTPVAAGSGAPVGSPLSAPPTPPLSTTPKPPPAPGQDLQNAGDFARDAAKVGLPVDCLGKSVMVRGRQFTIVGVKTRRPKYPVQVMGVRGGRYKLSVADVTNALGISDAPAPKCAGRPESEIMRDILRVFVGLSPENLTCDGELSRTQVARRSAKLHGELRKLEREIGRSVSEEEAWKCVR